MTLTKADMAWIKAVFNGTDSAVPEPPKVEAKVEKDPTSVKLLPGRWAVTKKGHKERVPSPKAKVGARHFGVRTDKEGAEMHFWTVKQGPRGLYYGDPSEK